MSSAGDESGLKPPYSYVSYAIQLFLRAIQPYVDELAKIAPLSMDYDVGEDREKGFLSLRLGSYPEDRRKDVLRMLYEMRASARLAAAVIRGLGFEVDVKVSAKKGILILWRRLAGAE